MTDESETIFPPGSVVVVPRETGAQQAQPNMTPGDGGVVPPVARRFGQPGGNPRNVRGVPRNAIELRRLIQQVGAEKLTLPQSEQDKLAGKKPEQIRRIKALVKAMYSSRAPADRAAILKAGWPGLLKDEIDLGDSVIRLIVEYTNKPITNEPESNA